MLTKNDIEIRVKIFKNVVFSRLCIWTIYYWKFKIFSTKINTFKFKIAYDIQLIFILATLVIFWLNNGYMFMLKNWVKISFQFRDYEW